MVMAKLAFLVSFFACCVLAAAQQQPGSAAASGATISLRDRVNVASKIYHQIQTFFPDLNREQFERDWANYLSQILGASDDRRAFDLATMALVATLHDGHTWFYDDWLGQNYGQPVGFTAYPLDGQWVVVTSRLTTINPGDVIEEIDGTPTQQYFAQHRKYSSASNERDAETTFFDTAIAFPERFTLTLSDKRKVTIDREHDPKQPRQRKTEGRWLIPNTVGYVKIQTFQGIETQVAALDYLKQFHDAKTIILDLRGNPGHGDPGILTRALINQPYPMWAELTSIQPGLLTRSYDNLSYPDSIQLVSSEALMRPSEQPVYSGRLILLIDRLCVSACEDAAMRFKLSKRADLLGETTAGTFSFTNSTQFANGMRLNVTAIRNLFPDKSRFEGVGIVPDVVVHPSARDLREKKDVVLERALTLAQQ